MKLSSSRILTRFVLSALSLFVILCGGCVSTNSAPVITSLETERDEIRTSGSLQIRCVASDIDGDELNYLWEATGGRLSGKGSAVTWMAPDKPGSYTVTVRLNDGKDGEVTRQIAIEVWDNLPPVIEKLTAKPPVLEPGKSSTIECVASEADGDELSYDWQATGGSISGKGTAITWMAPENTGTYTISVKVSDGKGGEASKKLSLEVRTNSAPEIESLTADPKVVNNGGSSTITCLAADPDGDELGYHWTATAGDFSGQGSAVIWTAPQTCATYDISVTVSDGGNGEVSKSLQIEVKKPG